ncbi:hypothetical protein [Clostridium frigidicarnis]|uniref:Transposase n=1 Tax=Clostridium frigidicarnis TaxID=84698 RepID=A0A1I0V2Y1_9CLOT|nr:hypothetical protein [Clostridium frigidicarnis]SFA70678.1 hypothetical protein SAMN04488528_1001124 [Clostridium frigidicarnis]
MYTSKNIVAYQKTLEIIRKEKCSQAIAAEKAGIKHKGFNKWLLKTLDKKEYQKLKKSIKKKPPEQCTKGKVYKGYSTIEKEFREKFKNKNKVYNVEILDWLIQNEIDIPVINFKAISEDMGKEFIQI